MTMTGRGAIIEVATGTLAMKGGPVETKGPEAGTTGTGTTEAVIETGRTETEAGRGAIIAAADAAGTERGGGDKLHRA